MLSVDNTVHRQHTQAQSSYFLWSFFSYLSESQHLWPSGRLLLLEGGLNLPSFMTSWPRGALCTGRYIYRGGPSCAEERKKKDETVGIWMGGRSLKWKVQQQKFGWWWWLEKKCAPKLCVSDGQCFEWVKFLIFKRNCFHFSLFISRCFFMKKNQTRTVTSRNKVLFLVSNLQLNNRNL